MTTYNNIIGNSGYDIDVSNLTMNTSSLYTTSGYNGSSGSIYLDNYTNLSSNPLTVNKSGAISITGEDADITMNGKSMRTWMENVEARLAILSPNPELEKDWDELKQLGERYRALEQELLEKAQTWEILKRE